MSEKILFPGYVLARFDYNSRLHVVTVPGLVSIVGFGGKPAVIPESEVEAVRSLVTRSRDVRAEPYISRGCAVEIVCGPLAGLRGIVDQVKGRPRIIVSISLLQRSVSAEIDINSVLPLPGAAA